MAGRWPKASSRDAILRVFAEHVADRGYAETSLAEVATELGLVKGTIFHHFPTKEALLGEVHVAYFGRRFAETAYIQSELDDPVTQVVAMIYALLAAHRDDRAASLACLRELVRLFDGGLNEYVRTERTRYTKTLVGIIRAGVRQGAFNSSDPEMTALQVFGMCNYAWTWYRPDGSKSVEEIATLFARDLLRGLSARNSATIEFDALIAKAIDTVKRAPGRLPGDARTSDRAPKVQSTEGDVHSTRPRRTTTRD
ncbi:TetR/AcrR family transcriptional regulator [Jatrophihabitans sp. DSM 45814]